MELFRLFGTILVDNTNANKDLEDTDKKGEKVAKTLGEITAEAGAMALGLAAAGAAALTALGIKSVTAADDFRKAMNTLQAQTGSTDEQMKGFEESTKRLYKANYGQSFDDIARSMSEISRTTGLSGAELEKTTKNALALRDTFEFGVNETAGTANSLMKQFGITSEEAYEIMAQSAQQGANKNGDLLDTLNEYSAMFKSAGYSAQEFGNILIQGAKDGSFSIDMVGDAVKESNIRLKDGSKQSREAVEGLGLVYDKIASDFSKGGELAAQAYNMVITNLGKIEDPLKKNDLAVKLFGTQFENLETTILDTLQNSGNYIDLTKSALDEINEVKYDSFGEALKGLGRQLEISLFVPLGEKIMPKLNEFIAWIQSNSPAIEAKLGGAVKVLAKTFDGFVKAIKLVRDNMNWLLPIITFVTAAIVAQTVIGLVTKLYKAWQVATATQTTLQWLLNKAIAANPFGALALVIAAVIAVGVLLYKNWDKVKEVLISSWEAIKNAAVSVWDWIMGFFQTKIGMIVAIIGGPITIGLMLIANWQKIKETAVSVFEWLKGFMDTTIGRIGLILMGPIGIVTLIIRNWDFLKTKAIEIFGSLKEIMANTWNGIVQVMKNPINLIIGYINTVIKSYESMINVVSKAINSIPSIKVPDWVPGMGGKEYGLPKLPVLTFPKIPMLAKGGTIIDPGLTMVGEQGPEILDLPKGASVIPLDKANGQQVVININNPHLFNDRDAEKLGDLLTRHLKLQGVIPRGV